MNKYLLESLNVIQWKNTRSVINWFTTIEIEFERFPLKSDIVES